MIGKKNLFACLVAVAIFLGFVLAAPPSWISGADTTNYTTAEDIFYYHNLSANITGFNNDVTFAVDTETNINWTNASGTYSVNKSVVEAWLAVRNSTSGNLTINATYDNQTGFFAVPIQATNTSTSEFSGAIFEFIVNATNDFPNFTNINTTYNFTSITSLLEYLNASDEESHYPLNFTVTFNSTSCTHAGWSGYNDNENCSLYDFGFNLTNSSNTTALMNFTPTINHVGVYYANISVRDAGVNYNSSAYPYQTSDYSQNKTTYYSSTVTFNILASLDVNITDCQNKFFQENQAGTCNITIRTKGEDDNLNFSSYSILRNYASGQSGVSNTSWFHANNSQNSSNFIYNITINVTPSKTEIGNWTINFTVVDNTYSENTTKQIYVYVNRTTNDVPDLLSVDNVNVSIDEPKVINLTVHDDDLLVPDKNSSFGGFNETITFNRTILNQSNLSQELTLSNFNITILEMPVSGTNKTTAEIRFTPNLTDVGDYFINVTVTDNDNTIDFGNFNLSIFNNTAPQWTLPLNTTQSYWEGNNTYLNLSQNITDADGDSLTFSYTNDTAFSSFSLNSTTSVINFTSVDADVGQHIVNITASDGSLTNTTSFNFTIYNVNDNPLIYSMSAQNATPTSISNNTAINATEDNLTVFTITLQDDDFRIPSGQKSFYNESMSVNTTFTTGPNSSFFSFVDSGVVVGNQTQFTATFTPGKADVGNYTFIINATDASSLSTWWYLNLTVLETQHSPVLSSLSNQTSGINRTLYYDMNVTDTEDGNDTSGTNLNFTFSYTNLSGDNIFSNYFNSTTGIFNITFNDSHAGTYRLNVSVNDSGGLIDYENFWIFVYGLPNVSSPSSGAILNLTENTTAILNFTVNHSVGDNLTYEFYVDSITYNGSYNYGSSILRNSTSYYGNGTSYNWSFTPNMTDETYGLLKNLTLVVYPNSSSLTNASSLNTTIVFKLNVSHANAAVSFDDNIDDQSSVHTSDITIDLYDHFSDSDHNDSFYLENLTFTPTINTSSITSSVSSSGVLTLAASTAVVGLVSVFGNDSSTNATSNNFTVTFTTPPNSSSTEQNSGSGGGTTQVPVSLKLILPDPISAFKKDRIELPITLYNDGTSTLYDITLNGSVAIDGAIADDVSISFSKSYFGGLSKGQKENLTMIIEIDTDRVGTFEINVNATVKSPYYVDWGKMFLTIKEGENVGEKIVFTEEFIVQNPECAELLELIDEAKSLLASGDSEGASKKSEEALSACREAISQAGKARVKQLVENKLYRYLIIATVVALLAGVGFYSYKRMKLRRMRGSFVQESIKNKKYLG
jgi:hypothetical protein